MAVYNDNNRNSIDGPCTHSGSKDDVIGQLKQKIACGENWYLSLLEAVRMWALPEEKLGERNYKYLTAGVAFDYALLVERLCNAIDGLIPEQEKNNLLVYDNPPLELDVEEFRKLIGEVKYRTYLNYLYGVVVENALLADIEGEIHKERTALVSYHTGSVKGEAYRRIYGTDDVELGQLFRSEVNTHSSGEFVDVEDDKEFACWRFKYRLKYCDKEKIASDTRRGLKWMNNQYAAKIASRVSSAEVRTMGSVIEHTASAWV
ncbi:MAG: hypothetical protein J7L90_04350 [Dehalococcoidia bacterium]|nr:hypothetical protein [Dehalococcoidia bacterium]